MSDRSLHNTRVAVALSGGVDSAVTAALLKDLGADVVALSMRLQKDDKPDDAVRVAEFLNVPLQILDMTEAFASCVIKDFLETYRRGETPVPCARCNRHLKFGALMDAAKASGAQALATGHYARRMEMAGRVELHKAVDPLKDQSYFLFALTSQQIDFLRFPLGEMTKEETRALALRYQLPVAQKKDSQDICFVPDGDYVHVLEELDPDVMQSGEIVDQQGQVLGHHAGIVNFTVGQRKGLNLSSRTGDHNAPLFVLSLDPVSRRVVVGPREALAQSEVHLRELNWLADDLLSGGDHVEEAGLAVTARLRSAQHPQPARFYSGTNLLRLAQPSFGVAPGQAGVIYQESRLLGGGWISRSQPETKDY